jgi:hypothetical protein
MTVAFSVPLEELHGALVLFCCWSRGKCAQVTPVSGFGIDLSGVQPKFAGFELPNHDQSLHFKLSA